MDMDIAGLRPMYTYNIYTHTYIHGYGYSWTSGSVSAGSRPMYVCIYMLYVCVYIYVCMYTYLYMDMYISIDQLV